MTTVSSQVKLGVAHLYLGRMSGKDRLCYVSPIGLLLLCGRDALRYSGYYDV